GESRPHRQEVASRMESNMEGTEKDKILGKMLLENLQIARRKSFVRSLCQTAWTDFRHKGLSAVFRYTRFDQFLHQRQRQRLIGREMNGPLGNLKTFQIAPKLFQRR